MHKSNIRIPVDKYKRCSHHETTDIEHHKSQNLLHDVFGSLQSVSTDPDQCGVVHVGLILPVTIHPVPANNKCNLIGVFWPSRYFFFKRTAIRLPNF